MNEAQMVPVAYIGHKERKEDNVARSGVVWHGHGDVQNVTAQQWGLLSAHPSVWAPAKQVAQAVAAAITLGSTAPMPASANEAPKTGPGASDPNAGETTAVNGDHNRPLQVLLGSDVLPAHIQIGDELVQLGTVVAKAQEASGLSVEAWNDLVPQIREKLLADYVEALRSPVETTRAAAQGEVSEQADPTKAPQPSEGDVKPAASTAAEQPTRRRRGAAAQGEVS